MALNKIPELFRLGENVSYWQGVKRNTVMVVEVSGDEVTVRDKSGNKLKFKARKTDGVHVALGTDDFEEEPDMIDHSLPNLKKPEPPKPVVPVVVPKAPLIVRAFSKLVEIIFLILVNILRGLVLVAHFILKIVLPD